MSVLRLLFAFAPFLGGCAAHHGNPRDPGDEAMFGPATMRLHPTFTQVKDWTADNKPDGIEAVIELDDAFGEPTRGTGTVLFELYAYRPEDPEPKGVRLANWVAPLLSRDDQLAHWNPAVRGYSFQLAFDKTRLDRTYVLTAQFDRKSGRFFGQIVIEATHEGKHTARPKPRAPLETPARG